MEPFKRSTSPSGEVLGKRRGSNWAEVAVVRSGAPGGGGKDVVAVDLDRRFFLWPSEQAVGQEVVEQRLHAAHALDDEALEAFHVAIGGGIGKAADQQLGVVGDVAQRLAEVVGNGVGELV